MQYSFKARAMHWGMGLMLIGMLVIGMSLDDLPQQQKAFFYAMHKSIGVLLFFIAVLRVIMRYLDSYPSMDNKAPKWMNWIAKINVIGMYVLMFLMPLSGFLMSNLSGYSVPFFGLFEIQSLVTNKFFAHLFHEIHELGGLIFITLIFLHIGGGLFHHFILKDNVLKRML